MRLLRYTFIAIVATLIACNKTFPADTDKTNQSPKIYPDYADVTIPVNIAPLNFDIDIKADDYITHIHKRDIQGIILSGKSVNIDIDAWHDLLKECKNDSIFIDVCVKNEGRWMQYAPIKIAVAEEPIDQYVSYRLIEPSYVSFEVMRINQRCLENFEETEIYNNCAFASETDGQCINCHNPRNYNRDGQWQMHARVTQGGTLIADNEGVKKINLKLPETISAGVYPAWHPKQQLIAYSNNNTLQMFHSTDPNKVEVQDNASDLILYDIANNEVSIVANDSTEWETFPAWSPDGSWLYYVSATVPALPEEELKLYRFQHVKDIKYNIYRKPFDATTKKFGATDTVYMASDNNASAILPRISPDGRYLLFTQAEYGTFHIWHHNADLYIIDLNDMDVRPLDEANSDDTESYHTWSSNGRWILMSSRRDDGNYTRLYISYFDKEGNSHKPFMLPQESPKSNILLFKSYNVPEFMVEPVRTSRNAIIDALNREPISPKFAGES